MRYLAELLIVLCCASCGGNTTSAKPEPTKQAPAKPEPTKQDPAPSKGGSGASEEPPSQAGAPAAELQVPCEGLPQPVCLQDCASLDRYSADCSQGQFQCPAGWVDLDSCSMDACARRSLNCCSASGQMDYPGCAADGTIGECSAGFKQASPCVPEGLGIETCNDIEDGSACASDELMCITGRCSRNCGCEVDPAGRLRWSCLTNAC